MIPNNFSSSFSCYTQLIVYQTFIDNPDRKINTEHYCPVKANVTGLMAQHYRNYLSTPYHLFIELIRRKAEILGKTAMVHSKALAETPFIETVGEEEDPRFRLDCCDLSETLVCSDTDCSK